MQTIISHHHQHHCHGHIGAPPKVLQQKDIHGHVVILNMMIIFILFKVIVALATAWRYERCMLMGLLPFPGISVSIVIVIAIVIGWQHFQKCLPASTSLLLASSSPWLRIIFALACSQIASDYFGFSLTLYIVNERSCLNSCLSFGRHWSLHKNFIFFWPIWTNAFNKMGKHIFFI